MRTVHGAVANGSPAIAAALIRIDELEAAYAAGVRCAIGPHFFLWELLISAADSARQRLVGLVTAWANDEATEAEVLEVADQLASLMERVSECGASSRTLQQHPSLCHSEFDRFTGRVSQPLLRA